MNTCDENQKNNDDGLTQEKNSKYKTYNLNIIGHIEGHVNAAPQTKTTKYEHIIPQLISAEQDTSIEGLLITLNTLGGDVEAGLALAEVISSLSKPTVSLVLGGGHSIGLPLAVSANTSFITPTASMTVHPVRINGIVIGAFQTYQHISKIQDQVAQFVTSHSRISRDEFMELMLKTGNIANDVGTVLFGREAVDCGIIDFVGGVSDAVFKLYELIEQKKQQ